MSLLSAVRIPPRPVAGLAPVIGAQRYRRLTDAAERIRKRLGGRTVWNVNSTAAGGGVAEMLQALVGYVDDLDIAIRWIVIGGDPEFFAVTKRLHNQIHGQPATSGDLGKAQADHYAEVLAANAADLLGYLRPGDIVLLHDPQTAGLTGSLVDAGTLAVWRCHIGADRENEATANAWRFLQPFLAAAHGYVFSRQRFVPSWVPDASSWIIPPSIDPLSPKNQDLAADTVRSILTTLGVLDDSTSLPPGRFVRRDGTTGTVRRTASVVGDGLPTPDEPVVLQVSRWDRLKDMSGVMRAFAEHVMPAGAGHLMLVGPNVTGVADDPESAAVYEECVRQWRDLPSAARARVLLVTLPLDDIDENAAMVNALQRHATVITQKSLAEGFGLTVAEGLWKGRPVIGSAVGGIQDQITHGAGILLPDPTDLRAFGIAVRRLLDDTAEAQRLGQAGRAHVRADYVGDLHLLRYAQLLDTLISNSFGS